MDVREGMDCNEKQPLEDSFQNLLSGFLFHWRRNLCSQFGVEVEFRVIKTVTTNFFAQTIFFFYRAQTKLKIPCRKGILAVWDLEAGIKRGARDFSCSTL